jgi:spore coat protein U-like protein
MTTMKKLGLCLALIGAAASVNAGTATGSLNVSATVVPKCTLGATSNAMGFGSYIQEGGNVDATVNLNLTCPAGTTATVGLDSVTAGNPRVMDGPSPGDALEFNLYKDAGFTTVWENSGAGAATVNYVAGGLQALPVYGRIFDNTANRAAAPGAYAKTVTITVTW